jgi:WD40 repeat protein
MLRAQRGFQEGRDMAGPGCLSVNDLRAYLLGDLPERVSCSVAAHLEVCAECEAAARQLDHQNDPLIDSLRQAVRTGSVSAPHPALDLPETVIGEGAGAAPSSDPVPARLVIEGYSIVEELGRGGMSIAFKAWQVHPRRLVVLKMVLAGAHAGAERRARFLAEADALARLSHPNIVQIYEVGENDGVPFLALEFMAGGSLARQLGGVPMQPRSAAALVEKLAGAVHYAHQQGIIHRDLKPANVMLAADGTPKIIDFGLAKQDRPELTATGAILGTPSYMAPEQAAGDNRVVGPAADIYGLGAVLYELLTGRPPFQGASALDTLEQVRSQEPVSPSQLQPRVPRDVCTICLKSLHKEPGRRYSYAGELADDLRRFLDGRPIRARAVGTGERTWRWCRRNPAVASLLAAVAALLAAVAVVSTFYAAHQKAAATELAGALRDSEAKRWESLRDQARAMRMSRHPGQRVKSLQAIQEAMQLPLPSGHSLDELRTEAIAALALPDVEVLQEWEGLPAGTVSLDFDGNLERYARIATDGTVSIRRVSDDAEIARWQERMEGDWLRDGASPRFSPFGRFLSISHSGSGRLTVWRLDGPEPIICYQGSKAGLGEAIDFSPDGKRLVYLQTDSRIAVVDLTSGQVRSLPPTGADNIGLREHKDRDHIRFAPDGRRFAFSIRRAGKWAVEVRDAATGQVQQSLPHPKGAGTLAWHPDGRTLATWCGDYRIRLWDLPSGRLLRVLKEHMNGGIRGAFTHTGDRLVSNDWNSVLRIWEPSSGRQLLQFPAGGYSILRVSPDDRVAAAHLADGTRLQLLRLHAGLEYRTISPGGSNRAEIYYTNPKVHPGGRLLAAEGTGGSVVLIDLASGREVAALPAKSAWQHPLHWEPSGDLLVYGTTGLIRWPVRAEPAAQAHHRLGPPEQLVSVMRADQWGSSADGQSIAIPDYSRGAIVVHRGGPARTVRLQPQQDVRNCAVSPDGHWVATGSHTNTDGLGAKVWDAATGELAKAFQMLGSRVTFSPDGRWLLTTAGGCRLWEVGSWKEGPKAGGAIGCFSPDGQILAVEDSAGAIRLVRPESGREMARLEAPEQTRLIPHCFTPVGTRLIAAGADTKALHVWDLRRIRKELVRLGLDWDAPPYPEADEGVPEPIEVQVVDAELKTATLSLLGPLDLNNLAWGLVTGPAERRDPVRALKLIEEALKQQPENADILNTLGVVRYRNGQYAQAVVTLEKSLRITKGEFAAFDLFFLAMCHAKLGDPAKAKACFDRAVKWMEGKQGLSTQYVEDLQAFQSEAEAELRIP